MKHHRYAAVALAAGAMIVGAAGPAAASSYSFTDRKREVSMSMDIERVTVVNDYSRTYVTVKHRKLVSGAGVSLWIDVDGKRPDYAIRAGTGDSDYYMFKTKGWKTVGRPDSFPGTCGGYYFRQNFRANTTSFIVDRYCLRGAKSSGSLSIAVDASMTGRTKDYAPGRRLMTPWIKRG